MLIPNIAKVGVESSNLFARSKSRLTKSGACRFAAGPDFFALDQPGGEGQEAQSERRGRAESQPSLGRHAGGLEPEIDAQAGGDENSQDDQGWAGPGLAGRPGPGRRQGRVAPPRAMAARPHQTPPRKLKIRAA